MKNPHGVEPTRFMKRKESRYAIECNPLYGPCFCDVADNGHYLFIDNNCKKENICFIGSNGTEGYECHPEHKSSLFVNTAGPEEQNYFSVMDYEVYSIDYEKQEYVCNACKHPDIMMKYIETKDVSEESLEQFDNDTELLIDLDMIHCDNSALQLRISQYYFKNPSEYLPGTRLVSQQYDAKLREWLGNCKLNLIYRASEHEYTGESFHECCDNKGPTLIVIKSSGGWIFGGYTTQSWSGDGM